MLTLMLGRIASMKTYNMINVIGERINRRKKSILIVPDHVTYNYEQRLCAQLGLNGFIDVEVCSFNRLAAKIIDYFGDGRKTCLDDAGKAMIMRCCLLSCRDKLTVFKGLVTRKGFPARCLKMISTLENCNYTGDDLRRVAGEVSEGILQQKLTDIATLYDEYMSFLADTYIDNASRLIRAEALLDSYTPLKDTAVFIDGFDVFTSRLLSFIKALMTLCDVTVAVSDAQGGGDAAAYEIHEITKKSLLRCARECGVPVTETSYRYTDTDKNAAVRYLQDHFYDDPAKPFSGRPDGLFLKTYDTPEEEVKDAARTIAQGVRRGERYRQYCILCNDMTLYSPLVKSVFSRYGITVYTDEKHDIAAHPTCAYLFAVLKMAASNMTPAAMTDYLCSRLTPFTEDECETFLSFIRDAHVSAKELESGLGKARSTAARQEEFEALRQRIVPPLKQVISRLQPCRTAREISKVLFDFLSEQGVYERLGEMVAKLEQKELYALSDTTAQLWNLSIGLLEKIASLTGDREISLTDYRETLKEGFSVSPVSTIPSVLDCVSFGDLRSGREREFDHVFILGANDGVIPAVFTDERIVSPQESLILQDHDLELAHTADTEDARIRYDIYAALTKPEETLTLSCPLHSLTGAPLRPSYIFRRMQYLFENLVPTHVFPKSAEEELQSPLTADQLRLAAASLPDSPRAQALASLEGFPELYSLLRSQPGTLIAPSLARELMVRNDSVSVSRLEKYAECPFLHYLTYGLRLEEHDDYATTESDIGSVFHQTLEEFTKNLIAGRVSEDEAQCYHQVEEIFEEQLKAHRSGVMLAEPGQRVMNGWLKKVACVSARQIQEAMGDFEPIRGELSFGYGKNPPLTVQTDYGELRLCGKIDRADQKTEDGQVWLRVVDYKTGKHDYKAEKVATGEELQILMYMNALLAWKKDALPAAAFYQRLFEESPRSGVYNENHVPKGTRSNIYDADGFRELLATAETAAEQAAAGILSGDVTPIGRSDSRDTGCKFCPYRPYCAQKKEAEEEGESDE